MRFLKLKIYQFAWFNSKEDKMSNTKNKKDFPEMSEEIKKIIHKMDNKVPLTELEKDKIADFEDKNGGFGGMGIFL